MDLPMSSKNNPPKAQKPPLTDPHHVPEIFANEFITAGIAAGIGTLTFATQRFTEGTRPDQPPRMERVVVSRLVLTHDALTDMVHQLMQLNQAIQQQKALAKVKADTTVN
jgi:hypothetical protein